MGRVRERMARLERATRGVAAGFCRCPGPVVVLFASGEPAPPFCGAEAAPVEPEPEPEVCPRCGRPRRQVMLTWNDGEGDESWR